MQRRTPLPVVRGSGCDRRQLLLGLGLGTLLVGCRVSLDEEAKELDVDGGVTPPEAPGGTAPCEGGVCLDLSHPDNVALTQVHGSRVLRLGAQRLIVVRTSESTFVALSAACTHAGSTVRYDPTRMDLACASHGSRFSLDGDVTQAPAQTPLPTFDTRYDAASNTLTLGTDASYATYDP